MPDKLTATILVVDDSAFDRAQIKQCLSAANPQIVYAFHEADWGREAVGLLKSYSYDGVFLNCYLPDMDGLTLLERLYDTALDAQTSPTVLITRADDERSRMEAMRFGVQEFLIKDHVNPAGVSLALQKAQAVHALKKKQEQDGGGVIQSSFERLPQGRETILVVEDVATVRQVAVDTLSRLGYKILEADSGSRALDVLKNQAGHIDLVFADIAMPGAVDGHALIHHVKQFYPEVKVLYASGYGQSVAKPYRSDVLANTLRAALDRQKARRTA